MKRPSEPYCRDSTTCNGTRRDNPHLHAALSSEPCTAQRAPEKRRLQSARATARARPAVALPCLQGPSPPHACPGRGSRAGRPPSACPTSGCGSSLRSRQSRHDPPAPAGSHTPRGAVAASGGHAGPCPPSPRLTDDHGLVGDLLDEAALLGLADVEVESPGAACAQREQQQQHG